MTRHCRTLRAQQQLCAAVHAIEQWQQFAVVAPRGSIGQNETLERRLGLLPVDGAFPEQRTDLIEIGSKQLGADFIMALQVPGKAKCQLELVVVPTVTGVQLTQHPLQMSMTPCNEARFRPWQLDLRQLHIEDVCQCLDRKQVGLRTPAQVDHHIRPGRWLPQRRTKSQVVGQGEGEVVDADRLDVHVLSTQLGIACVERIEVTVADHRVADAPGGKVHHRVTDMSELQIEHREHAPVRVVELPVVPQDRRLTSTRIGPVPLQPAKAEFHQWFGVAFACTKYFLVAQGAETPGFGWRWCPTDSRGNEWLERQRVDCSEDLQVVIDHRMPVTVTDATEVLTPRNTVHDVGVQIVDPAVDACHRDAKVVQQGLEAHLVFERKDQRNIDALATHTKRKTFTVALGIHEPDRAPACLTLDTKHPCTEMRVQPVTDSLLSRRAVLAHHLVLQRPSGAKHRSCQPSISYSCAPTLEAYECFVDNHAPMKIMQPQSGPVSSHRFCVAPMMEWTDRHFRFFARLLSRRALLYTEMLTSAALIHGERHRLLDFDCSEHPLALQLGGSDPRELAAAARIGEDWGYDEINLNVGCPSDRVQSGRFGACLMAEPELVAECVAAMRATVRVPVTVKCRIGIDERDSWEELVHFVATVTAAGAQAVIVHARKAWLQGLSPKENREIPPLHYPSVHRLKHEFPALAIVINGGIGTLDDCDEHLRHVDGVMLGRSAYHDPWLLARVDSQLFGTTDPMDTRHHALDAFLPYVERQLAEGCRLHQISRHVLGLFHGCPGGRRFRRHIAENAYRDTAGIEVLRDAAAQVPRECEPRQVALG